MRHVSSSPGRSRPGSRGWVRAVLSAALGLTACGQGPGEVLGTPEDAPRALVVGPVQSAVFDELGKRVRMVQSDGTQKVDDYGLLILDGDAHTAQALKENALVAEALRKGKWVLGVDLGETHKKDGLGGRLGFTTKGNSPGYLVRAGHDGASHPQVWVVEHGARPVLVGDVTDGLMNDSLTALRGQMDATRFARAVTQRIASDSRLTPQDATIPPGLISKTYYYSQPFVWTAGNAGKKDGTQTVGFQYDWTFNVYLDNQNNPQGNFQWVAVDIDGMGNPTNGTGKFLNAYDSPSKADNNTDEWAWFQDQMKVSIQPSATDTASFTAYGSSPETVNNVTSVTSTLNFSVGFAGPQGQGSFGYSNSQTRNIQDWKMTNNSGGNTFAWNYRSASPLNADVAYYAGTSGQDAWAVSGYPKKPNDLSMNQLQLHTQGVWKTTGVLTNWVTFETYGDQHLADLYCETDFWAVCLGDASGGVKRGYAATTSSLSINMASVVPIPVQAITFSQNPAVAGSSVTGTLFLSSPAVEDTTIQLSSTSPASASVLPTVTIPQGQTSANFQVSTIPNGGTPGTTFGAVIQAFYAQNYQAQLTMRNYGLTDLLPPASYPSADPQRWAQNVPFGKWVAGYQVRYAVSFVGPNGETDRGPWTPWFSGEPYALPFLVNVPTDSSGRATARKVYRQFYADYNSDDPSAGVTLIGTLNDNTTTTLQDNSF